MKKLIDRLFKTNTALPPVADLPTNTRVYCIGDIHGRVDLLLELTIKIQQDSENFSGQKVIVYLGDFIDRGINSKEVIELLIENKQPDVEYIYLRGNHEQTMLDFLQEDSVGRSWLTYGGQATLASYGVAISKIPTKKEDFIEIQRQLRNNLPDNHFQFLVKTQYSYSLGSYFFVHAGINPRYPLTKQNPEDMLWIRDDFTHVSKPFEKIIVHGHTVTREAELLPNRIGIDTGAYASGILTCLVLEDNTQRLIQTGS